MIWRRARPEDQSAILFISREPMNGKIKLVWGLDKLEAPRGCNDLQVFVIEDDGKVQATAMSWLWPSGDRYLSGLRFSSGFKKRPPRDIWEQAFCDMLAGREVAWTCIGKDNLRARKILESKQSFLPHYQPRAELTTWFIPLSGKQQRVSHQTDHRWSRAFMQSPADTEPPKGGTPRAHTSNQSSDKQAPGWSRSRILDTECKDLEPADWRHVAVASGGGLSYLSGRALHALGLPGIPAPGRRMELAYLNPRTCENSSEMKDTISEASGYDGIVVVLEKASTLAREWRKSAPKLSWQWESTLYQVSWDANQSAQAIPDWKGIWL